MTKRFSKMSLEELWRLFPVNLEEHNPQWLSWYEEERSNLLSLLGDVIEQIDHIGSTYIPGLIAKPVVDILLQVSPTVDIERLKSKLLDSGWLLMAENSAFGLLDLNKGYTPDGFAERVFHLHIRYLGDHDELQFRNYIASHPDDAAEYAALKRRLLAEYKYDRDAYTEAKTEFVRAIIEKSKNLEEMSEFFNDRAERYDEIHISHIGGGMESKRIIASLLPDNSNTLIDLGIGTGLELEAIFKRFPDIEVTGLDVAENMLKRLKNKYAGKNIKLYHANYLDYDFGSGLFDAAISVMTLHHYSHEVKTGLYCRLKECLKPNGIYIECDYMLSELEYENAQEKEDFYFSEYDRIKREQGITDGREYHYDTPCTLSNQKAMLKKAGFKTVKEVWREKDNIMLIAKKQ